MSVSTSLDRLCKGRDIESRVKDLEEHEAEEGKDWQREAKEDKRDEEEDEESAAEHKKFAKKSAAEAVNDLIKSGR